MSEFDHILNAAHGYIALGLFEDAWEELETLPPEMGAHSTVIFTGIEIYNGMKKWGPARVLAESMARSCPENPDWWISWAFALRREQSIEPAREALREAVQLHPEEALISYNLACYACVFNELDEARALCPERSQRR